jgi:hypothetical protein
VVYYTPVDYEWSILLDNDILYDPGFKTSCRFSLISAIFSCALIVSVMLGLSNVNAAGRSKRARGCATKLHQQN